MTSDEPHPNAFVNAQLEHDFLVELFYWGAELGKDPIAEYHLDSHDLCEWDLYKVVWQLLLNHYEETGRIEIGPCIAFTTGEDRKHILSLTSQSTFAVYESIPFEGWARELRRLAHCRQIASLQGVFPVLTVKGCDPLLVAHDLCDRVEKIIFDSIPKSSDEDYSELIRLLNGGGVWRTGIEQLDSHGKLGGWYTVLASRSHHGKTAAMVSMMVNLLLAGQSVFMWQGEQTSAQVRFRMVCQLSGLSPAEVLTPTAKWMEDSRITAEHQVREWLHSDKGARLFLHDGRLSIERIFRMVRGAQSRAHISMVFIDQLSSVSKGSERRSREEAYSIISECIRDTSRDLKQPVMLALQLNIKDRKDGSSVPAFWQMKDCGRPYEDCDLWLTVDRPAVDADRMKVFNALREKAEEKKQFDDAEAYDVGGRVRMKVEKDRFGMFGLYEEWLDFVRSCGRIESRLGDLDRLTRFRPREDREQRVPIQEDLI